jgi:hypothetical protein
MRAPRPPSGPLIFNRSYNAEQVRLIVGRGVCRVAPYRPVLGACHGDGEMTPAALKV